MEYLIKNKKFIFIVLLFLFFMPFKVNALVFKGNQDINFNTTSFNGTLSSNGLNYVAQGTFTNPVVVANYPYDFIGIKMNRFNFVKSDYFSVDNPELTYANGYRFQCTNSSGDLCNYANIQPIASSVPVDLLGSIDSGDITISANLYGNQTATPCWFDSSISDNIILCPLDKTNTNYTHFIMIITVNGYESIDYYIDYSNLRFFYNYDSTEIVKGLTAVQNQTVAVQSAIEQQTQQQAQQNAYVQSSNISQAQTNTSDNITVLNDQLTAELSQFSDLTQLVVAPITMFMELNNNVCAPLTLQIPFVNQTAVLPCIKPIMTQYFGGMYSVFTTVIGAILCYWTFVRTVALIKDLVDADNDKIEVVDL